MTSSSGLLLIRWSVVALLCNYVASDCDFYDFILPHNITAQAYYGATIWFNNDGQDQVCVRVKQLVSNVWDVSATLMVKNLEDDYGNHDFCIDAYTRRDFDVSYLEQGWFRPVSRLGRSGMGMHVATVEVCAHHAGLLDMAAQAKWYNGTHEDTLWLRKEEAYRPIAVTGNQYSEIRLSTMPTENGHPVNYVMFDWDSVRDCDSGYGNKAMVNFYDVQHNFVYPRHSGVLLMREFLIEFNGDGESRYTACLAYKTSGSGGTYFKCNPNKHCVPGYQKYQYFGGPVASILPSLGTASERFRQH